MRWGDAAELVKYCRKADLVVFDSQRMFLSDLGLKEDVSDDYATFMAALIDPLFQAGVATLTLDNTGHTDKTRGRGTSSKGDLNEIIFSLQQTEEFDLYRTGQVKLKVEKSRFGNMGEWTMRLGGGAYESWLSGGPAKPREDFLAAVVGTLMKWKQPLGMDRLLLDVRKLGVHIGTDKGRDLLNQYVGDPEVPVIWDNGYALRSDDLATPDRGGVAATPEPDGVARRDTPAES